MASEISTYQCPSCTGPLEFNTETGKLHCKFCRSVFTAEEIDASSAMREQKAAAAYVKKSRAKKEKAPEEWSENMREYSCPSCGAVLAADENTAVLCCPYCGNQGVVAGQFSGMQKPDYVIPFKVSREDAMAALKAHYKGKPFLPGKFKSRNMVEKVQGVYVPFWLFDATVEAQCQFDGQIIKDRDNKKDRVLHHDSRRGGTAHFKNVPVDASERMDDNLMDSILPYRYREKKPFSMAYFAGYLAEKYDVSMDECAQRAEEQCTNTTVNTLMRDARRKGKYDNIEVKNVQHSFTRDELHYVMFPVWLVSTKWKGKPLQFAINGQTGKIAGDLPISQPKYWASVIGWTALIGSLLYVAAAVSNLL